MDKKESRNGYSISRIYEDFRRSTGKDLDLKFFRFRKLSNLLQEFRDVGTLKRYDVFETKLFPEKPALQITSRETNYVKEFSMENQMLRSSSLERSWKRVEMHDNVQVLQTSRACNEHLSTETNGISLDITGFSQLSTSTDFEIMRKSWGESSKAVSAVLSDHHSKTADEIFSFDEQSPQRESAVDGGLDMIDVCSIRSMSAVVGELIVTPTISSQSAQKNQQFEDEKMKKRHSHKIPRRGCMHSCLQHFIMYVYEWLTQKSPRRNG